MEKLSSLQKSLEIIQQKKCKMCGLPLDLYGELFRSESPEGDIKDKIICVFCGTQYDNKFDFLSIDYVRIRARA